MISPIKTLFIFFCLSFFSQTPYCQEREKSEVLDTNIKEIYLERIFTQHQGKIFLGLYLVFPEDFIQEYYDKMGFFQGNSYLHVTLFFGQAENGETSRTTLDQTIFSLEEFQKLPSFEEWRPQELVCYVIGKGRTPERSPLVFIFSAKIQEYLKKVNTKLNEDLEKLGFRASNEHNSEVFFPHMTFLSQTELKELLDFKNNPDQFQEKKKTLQAEINTILFLRGHGKF